MSFAVDRTPNSPLPASAFAFSASALNRRCELAALSAVRA